MRNGGPLLKHGYASVKLYYLIGIWINSLISIIHLSYAYGEFESINETSLWFVSGGLALIFNTCLNYLNLRQGLKLLKQMTFVTNLVWSFFIGCLALVVQQPHTYVVLLTALYITGAGQIYASPNTSRIN